MFCPNCGTQNEDTATPCKKCGFKLSGVSLPKFKGTMMLNSEQTVQELIEEHRRRQSEEGARDQNRRASEPPPPSRGSVPPGSFGTPRGPVFQPPRAAAGAAARRRMGGTMLGVAPQAGGLLPPELNSPRPGPVEPVRNEPALVPAETPPADAPVSSGPADPLAGTAAMPVVEPAAAPGRDPAPAGVDETSADDAVDEPERTPAQAEPQRVQRAVPATAPLPQQPSAPSPTTARGGGPERLSALDIVLIVVTLGLYGIVLWLKQRKPQA